MLMMLATELLQPKLVSLVKCELNGIYDKLQYQQKCDLFL